MTDQMTAAEEREHIYTATDYPKETSMSDKPTTYRKKPVEIEAMQYPYAYDGEDSLYARNNEAMAIIAWMTNNRYPGLVGNALEPATLRYPDQAPNDNSRPDKGWWIEPSGGALMIRTLEGVMRVGFGDYVIRGVQGEFYPCRGDIFRQTYEAVGHE